VVLNAPALSRTSEGGRTCSPSLARHPLSSSFATAVVALNRPAAATLLFAHQQPAVMAVLVFFQPGFGAGVWPVSPAPPLPKQLPLAPRNAIRVGASGLVGQIIPTTICDRTNTALQGQTSHLCNSALSCNSVLILLRIEHGHKLNKLNFFRLYEFFRRGGFRGRGRQRLAERGVAGGWVPSAESERYTSVIVWI
jgi:hypothetical protein